METVTTCKHENDFRRLLVAAHQSCKNQNYSKAEPIMVQASKLFDKAFSNDLKIIYFNNMFIIQMGLKHYNEAYNQAIKAEKNIKTEYILKFKILQARAFWYRDKKKQSFHQYVNNMVDGFLYFDDEDCIILSGLLRKYTKDFSMLQWADYCRERLHYIPFLYDEVISVEESDSLFYWAEKTDYLLSTQDISYKGLFYKNKENNQIIDNFLDHELFPLFIQLFNTKSNALQSLVTSFTQNNLNPFCKLLVIENSLRNEELSSGILEQALALEKWFKDFPRYHLIMLKIIKKIDPTKKNKMSWPVIDQAIKLCRKGYLKLEVNQIISEYLNLDLEKVNQLISTQQMKRGVEKISRGYSNEGVIPLLQISAMGVPYFSKYAFTQLKRVALFPSVQNFLTGIQKKSGLER